MAIFVAQVAIYNAILPTVPDALYAHPTQVMGHKAYLSDFLALLYAGSWLTVAGSLFVGIAGLVIYSVLNEREKERRHNIRVDWMKSRSEFGQ